MQLSLCYLLTVSRLTGGGTEAPNEADSVSATSCGFCVRSLTACLHFHGVSPKSDVLIGFKAIFETPLFLLLKCLYLNERQLDLIACG